MVRPGGAQPRCWPRDPHHEHLPVSPCSTARSPHALLLLLGVWGLAGTKGEARSHAGSPLGSPAPYPALTLAVLEQQLPDAAAGVGVDAGRGLVQDDHPGAAHEGDGHRELALHPPCGAARMVLGMLGTAEAMVPPPGGGTQPCPTHPRGSWSARGACGAAPCPAAAAPSPPSPAPPPAPSAARRTRCAPPLSCCGAGGVHRGGPAVPAPPKNPALPCLHVKEHVVLRAHPQGFADAVDVAADVPAQHVGSAGGGGQEAGQDGPGEGWGAQGGGDRHRDSSPHPTWGALSPSSWRPRWGQRGWDGASARAQLPSPGWVARLLVPWLTWWWSCRPRCGPGRR